MRWESPRLRQGIQILREEIRIKLEPQKRPHHPPTARLAILELRAARHWSLAQTARTFLVTPLTIASWTARLDEEGPEVVVRLPEPVNRGPDFVAYLVNRLRGLCPGIGKVKLAQVLARAGLHLAPTTVRRTRASVAGSRQVRKSPTWRHPGETKRRAPVNPGPAGPNWMSSGSPHDRNVRTPE